MNCARPARTCCIRSARDRDLERGAACGQRGAAVAERGAAFGDRGTRDQQGRTAVGQRGADDRQLRAQGARRRDRQDQRRPEEPDRRQRHRDDLRRCRVCASSASRRARRRSSTSSPSDAGRSLLDITHRLDYADLAEDAREVFASLRTIEREVRSARRSLVSGAPAAVPHARGPDRGRGAQLHRHQRAPPCRGTAARRRGADPAGRRDDPGFRDHHARSGRPDHELEQGRRADVRLRRADGDRPACQPDLHARRPAAGRTRGRAAPRRRAGPGDRRALASAQRRHRWSTAAA